LVAVGHGVKVDRVVFVGLVVFIGVQVLVGFAAAVSATAVWIADSDGAQAVSSTKHSAIVKRFLRFTGFSSFYL